MQPEKEVDKDVDVNAPRFNNTKGSSAVPGGLERSEDTHRTVREDRFPGVAAVGGLRDRPSIGRWGGLLEQSNVIVNVAELPGCAMRGSCDRFLPSTMRSS